MKYIALALASTALAAAPLLAQNMPSPAPESPMASGQTLTPPVEPADTGMTDRAKPAKKAKKSKANKADQSAAASDVAAPAEAVASADAPAPTTADASASAPAATVAASAAAPAKANIAAGAMVADASGAAVGTIESVSGANAVLSTGTAKATLPLTAFAQAPNGLVIGMTKAQVEAAVAQATGGASAAAAPASTPSTATASAAPTGTAPAAAAMPTTADASASVPATATAMAAPSFKVGASVSDQKGGKVGTVQAIAGDLVTVATASTKAQLPKNAFAQGPNGLVIAMTAGELDAAAKSAAPKKSGG